jgi:uncharacterized membrane protein required for colicin V production
MIGTISSAPIMDLVVVVFLFGAIVLGVLQGPIRGFLAILSMLIAFVLASNLRDSLGDWLAGNWRQFPDDYNRLLAFVIVFVFLTVLFIVLIQGFYKRTELYAARPIVDDVLGGVAGFLEGFIVLVMGIIILGSYQFPASLPGEVAQLRQLHDLLLNQSNIGSWIHDTFAPVFVQVLSPLLPHDVVASV